MERSGGKLRGAGAAVTVKNAVELVVFLWIRRRGNNRGENECILMMHIELRHRKL